MLRTCVNEWAKRGDAFVLKVATIELHILAHPEAAEHVLKTRRGNFVKGDAYNGFRRIAGDGLLTAEGEDWRAKRRRIQPAFSRAALDGYADAMSQISVESAERWEALAREQNVLDISAESTRLTLRIVGRTLFGLELGDAADDSSKAFGAALHYASVSGSRGLPIPRWVPTPANRRMDAAMRDLDATVHRIIASARSRVAQRRGDADLLYRLLDSNEPGEEPISDAELRDEVITLFLAGHETSALALAWTLDFIARDRQLQRDIFDEIAQHAASSRVTLRECEQMPLLRAVIDESLRLRAPIWAVARNVVERDEIMGREIAAGAIAVPTPYLIHRHPDFWEQPEVFRPGRFLGAGPKHEYAYLPFSRGPRMCIGAAFALYELQIALATLLQRVEVFPVDPKSPEPRARVTLAPALPIRLLVRRR